MAATNELQAYVLDALRGVPFSVAGGKLELALHTESPVIGMGAEVSDPAYKRQEFTLAPLTAPSGDSFATTNATTITFPEATKNWGLVGYYAIAAKGGSQQLFTGQLSSVKNVETGDQIRIDAGSLKVTIK